MKAASLLGITSIFLFTACSKNDTGSGEPKPVAGFSFTGAGLFAPDPVTFTNTSTNATSYSWSFGDGSNSTDQDPIHNYTTGGTYTVTLTATGDGGSATVQQSVTIIAPPTKMVISSITISNFPATAPGGGGWDTNSGPDIYIKIGEGQNPTSFTYTSPNFIPDVVPGINYQFTVNTTLTDNNSYWTIELWDNDASDAPPKFDDEMGGIYFLPSSFNNYPPTITLQTDNFTFVLNVTWQ